MIGARYPVEDQMVTAVAVKDGNPHVLAGTTVVSKPRGIVIRFEPHDSEHVPSRGQTVTLLYGGGERVLRLRTVVAEIIGGLKLLLEPVAEVTEGERREFLRAQAEVKLYARVVGPDFRLPGEDESALEPDPGFEDLVVDLSGSGVKFLWDKLCRSGDLMLIRLVLPTPEDQIVNAVAEVVRAVRDADSGKMDVAVHFSSVSEHDRDRMINYVFRRYYEQLGSALTAEVDSDA